MQEIASVAAAASLSAYRLVREAFSIVFIQQVPSVGPSRTLESNRRYLDANDTEVPGCPECSLHVAAGVTTALL